MFYTRIQSNLAKATPDELARRALASVCAERSAPDGISYLIEAIEDGIATAKSAAYRERVLALSGQSSVHLGIATYLSAFDESYLPINF